MRTQSEMTIPFLPEATAKPCSAKKKPRRSSPEECSSLDWSSLPDELLELILQRLREVSDYVRFGAVCRRWRRVFAEKRDSLALDQPWIWVHEDSDDVYCLSERRLYCCLRLPIFFNKWSCCGSQHGWLAFVRDSSRGCLALLVNPFSGEQVHLPEISSTPAPAGHILLSPEGLRVNCDKFCCSLPPDDPHCVVVYIQFLSGMMAISSAQSMWVTYERPYPDGYASAIFYNGSLYALTFKGELCIVDLSSHERDGRPAIETVLSQLEGNRCSPDLTLIEHRGELLLCCLGSYQRTLSVFTFDVYRANLELFRWEVEGIWQAERHFASEGFDLMSKLKNQIGSPSEVDIEIGSQIILYQCMRRFPSVMLSPHPW